jgi:hypothetical protein
MVAANLVNVTHLAAGKEFKFRKISLQENGIESLGSHEESLDVKTVAYSSRSEFFVNGRE